MIQDLALAIDQWKEEGDHIILGMDANEDARDGTVNDALMKLGLREAILDRHQDKSPQATHNRNKNRTPIDGIWISPSIYITVGGYLPFGEECPSDHVDSSGWKYSSQ
jgi:hypothetical protein